MHGLTDAFVPRTARELLDLLLEPCNAMSGSINIFMSGRIFITTAAQPQASKSDLGV